MILDMPGGKVLRNPDYWDSAQLSEADISGPQSKTGIAFPAVPVHPDGPLNPRSAAEFTRRSSASPSHRRSEKDLNSAA
jgi:hypothetical protein